MIETTQSRFDNEGRSHEAVHPSGRQPHGEGPVVEALRHNSVSGLRAP
jgi:hypothetical protein